MKNLNKKFSKAISLFIGLVLILSGLPLTANAQAFFDVSYPILKTSNYTDNPNTANWQQTISAKPGDIVSFLIYYYNNGNETAKNVKVRLDLPPQKNTSQTIKSYVWGENANWVSGSVTINLSSAENFTLIPETIAWYPNQSATPSALLSGQNGSEIIQVNGLSLGDIPAGTASRGYVKVRAKISQSGSTYAKFDTTYPVLQISSYSTQTGSSANWANTLSAGQGEIVSFKIYYFNNGNTAAKNTKIRIDLPSQKSTSHNIKAYLWAENTNYVEGSTTLNLSSAQNLSLIPNNVYWYPNNQGTQIYTLPNSQTGSVITQANGLLLGDIGPGSSSLSSAAYTIAVADESSRGYVIVRAQISQDPTVTTPLVSTSAATSIDSNSAVLNGYLNSLGNASSADIWFEWGTTTACSNSITHMIANTTGAFQTTLTGLSANTTYYFKAAASNSTGTSYGEVRSFTTSQVVVGLPSVSTNQASGLSTNSAILNGSLDSLGTNSNSADVWFEYGTTTNYGNTTAQIVRTSTGSFSTSLSNLSPNTTYHFRAAARNGAGTVYGSNQSFTTTTTSITAPSVSTNAASSINNNSAILNGSLDNLGNASTVDVRFEYGTTTSFGSSTSISTRNSTGLFNASISNLSTNTIYYFRAVASNSAGTVYGSTYNFITTSQSINYPSISTSYASSISDNSATLNGYLNNLGNASSVDIWFDWGTTTNCGNSINHMTGGATGGFISTLTGLSANTTYYFRAMASNSAGTSYGSVLTFTTQISQTSNQPEVMTLAATEIENNSAILNSQVNAHGFSSRVYFVWGENYSNLNDETAYSNYSGTTFRTFNYRLTNLKPSTLYYYRAIALTGSTKIYGEIKSFFTKAQISQPAPSAPKPAPSAPKTQPAPTPTTTPTTTPVCTVGEWQKSTCGGGGCLNYERLEKRSVDPSGCDIETRCLPDLECSKITKVVFLTTSIASETAEPGEIIDYKITYKNTLSESITNTLVNITIPEGAVFQKFTTSKGRVESFMTSKSGVSVSSVDTLILNLGNLASNEEGEITVKIRIDDNVAEESILNFPVQLSYNDPQITVFSSDTIKIKKIRGAFSNIAGALGGLAGFGIPVWLITIIVLAIILSLAYLKKDKERKLLAVFPQNNKINGTANGGNGNSNHNGSNKVTIEISKPDLSPKSSIKKTDN